MKYKKFYSLMAVAIMLLAGSACLIEGAVQGRESDDSNIEESDADVIKIDDNTQDTKYTKYNATYIAATKTLTFDGCNAVYEGTEKAMVYAPHASIKIILKGENSFTFKRNDSSKDMWVFDLYAGSSINGPGSMTLNIDGKGKDVFGIVYEGEESNLLISNCDIDMKISVESSICSGLYYYDDWSGVVSIKGSNLKIDMEDSKADNRGYGIYTVQLIVISSNVDIKFGLFKTNDWESDDGTACIDCGMFFIEQSHINIVSTKQPAEKEQYPYYGVYAYGNCYAFDSEIDIDISDINDWTGIYCYSSTACFIGSTVKLKVEGGDNSYGVDFRQQEYTKFCDYNSDLTISGSKYALNGLKVSDIDTRSKEIYAWDTGSQPATTVEVKDVIGKKNVHFVTSFMVSFYLGGGTGTAKESKIVHTGDEITLPDCDAKLGDREFIGWSDGNKLYEAGEKYTVVVGVTFVAMYGEPPVEPGPTFEQLTPSPSKKVTDREFTVSGVIKDAVKLTVQVNGGAEKRVDFNQRTGAFSFDVELSGGYNGILLKATDANGNVTEKTVSVTYDSGSSGGGDNGYIVLIVAIIVILAIVLLAAIIIMRNRA